MPTVFGGLFSCLQISPAEPAFPFYTDPQVKKNLLNHLGKFLATGERPQHPIPSLPTWFIPSENIQLDPQDPIRGYGEHSVKINAGFLTLNDGRRLPVALKKVPFKLALTELRVAQILDHYGVLDVPYLGLTCVPEGGDLQGYARFNPQDSSQSNLLEDGLVWLVTYRFKHASEYSEPASGIMPFGLEVYRPDLIYKNDDTRISHFFSLHQAAMQMLGFRPCLDEETFLLQNPQGWSAGFIDLHHPRIESLETDPSHERWRNNIMQFCVDPVQREALVSVWHPESRDDLRHLLQKLSP